MIMTRPLYSDLEFFRRTDRGVHMPLGQGSPVHDHYEAAGHLSNRTTPSSEPDSRAPNGSRKRVPVACERCRKRKIKCSGNEGDSKSCINCKNSGHEESCHFLRVQSFVASHLGFRDPYASQRYAPYTVPSHRLNYVPVPSRCTPQSTIQYHSLPSSVEYGPYTNQSTAVDWRQPYTPQGGPYSPYPDEEDSSPYTSQPPSYMLPNTDPMSANNSYYIHGHGARPPPGALWSEPPQHFIPQPAPQLTGVPYTMAHETSQPFQSIGIAGSLSSDRVLPQPISVRSYIPTPASSIDFPLSSSGQRHNGYWHGETNATVQQLPTPVEATSSQAQILGREGASYRLQEMTYPPTHPIDGLSVSSATSGPYIAVIEGQSSAAASSSNDPSSQQSAMTLITPESQKSSTESGGVVYDYTSSVSNHTRQLRTASGQLRPGPLYCQTEMLPRRESGSDECSPDCTSCQTESTRTSLTSITSTSAGC